MPDQIVDVYEFKDPKTGRVFTAQSCVINGERAWLVPLWVKSEPHEWLPVK